MKVLILSDLHLGHRSSRAPALLAPLSRLAQQFDQVIINGDALEKYSSRSFSHDAHRWLDRLKTELATQTMSPLFITGNHDPVISETHFVFLEEPGLLVLHGDYVLKRSAPWHPLEKIFEKLLTASLEQLGPDARFEETAQLFRKTQAAFLDAYPIDNAHRGRLHYILHHLFPPTSILLVLHYWWHFPGRIARLAQRLDFQIKRVAFGHSHRAGCWVQDGIQLYNTGSFMPFSNPSAVVVDGDAVTFTPLAALLP